MPVSILMAATNIIPDILIKKTPDKKQKLAKNTRLDGNRI